MYDMKWRCKNLNKLLRRSVILLMLVSGFLINATVLHKGLAKDLRSDQVMTTTAQSEPPIASIDFPVNNSIIEPTQVNYFEGGSSNDPDGGSIEYLWEIDPIVASWGFPTGNPETRSGFSTRITQPGNYTITLTVTDDEGDSATTKILLQVKRGSGSIASETITLSTTAIISTTETKPILTVRPSFLPGFSVLPVIFALFIPVLLRRKRKQ